MSRVRIVAIVAGIVALQGLALWWFSGVKSWRRTPATAFRIERLSGTEPASPVEVEGPDARVARLEGGPSLLHFWATWCPPCREELPAVLALGRELARERGIRFRAVSLDDDWSAVRRFFDGELPPEVVRLRERGAIDRYGLSNLPDSYVVGTTGMLVARVAGACDWASQEARARLRSALDGSTP